MKRTELEGLVQEVIVESTKVNFGKYTFLLKVDTNEDPQKMGVRISFIPTEFGQISSTTLNDIAIELENRLGKGLEKYNLRVERDRAVRDKSVIRFIIHVEYFSKLIRKALEDQNPKSRSETETLQ